MSGTAGLRTDELASWQATLGSQRVVFGPGSLASLGDLAAGLELQRVLLVTDPGVRRAGHAERAAARLAASGIAVHLFDAVANNPTSEHIEAAADFAAPLGVDGIVGLGGGSAMDCAKGANFLLTQGGTIADYRGYGKARKPMLASIGIPTTAGTGSEAQSYALVADARTHEKMACGDPKARFRAVILDPTLAPTAPREVVAAAGMDALAHALESYVTRTRNAFSTLFAGEAWSLLEGSFERVLGASAAADDWARMLRGAHLGGQAIEHSMLGAAHGCANPLTARFGVIHAHAVGLMLPHVMRFNASVSGAAYERLAQGTNGVGKTTEDLVARVVELRSTGGLPERLREVGVPREALALMAREAAGQWTASHNPVPLDARAAQELYEAAW